MKGVVTVSGLILMAVFFLPASSVGSSISVPMEKPVKGDSVLQSIIPSSEQTALIESLGKNTMVQWNPKNGTPLNIFCTVENTNRSASAADAAREFLSSYSSLFRLGNPLQETRLEHSSTDEIGMTHVRFTQSYEGVPVWGSYYIFHFASGLTLRSITANSYPSHTVSNRVALDSASARAIAQSELSRSVSHQVVLSSLCIFPSSGQYRYAWSVIVSDSVSLVECWRYFVDAETGAVLLKFRDVHFDGPAVGSGVSQDGSTKSINTYLYNGIYYLVDATKQMFQPPFANLSGVIVTSDCYNDENLNTDSIFYDYNGDNQFNESVYL